MITAPRVIAAVLITAFLLILLLVYLASQATMG